MPRRPPELIYALDERPPLVALVALSLQHLGLLSIFVVVPVVLARTGGLSQEAGAQLVALTMVAAGVGSILQSVGRGVGSGYLVPTATSTIMLPPSQAAVVGGGPALVGGMTVFAGLLMLPLARVIPRLRVLFPPEIVGFVLFVSGVSMLPLAADNLFGIALPAEGRAVHLVVSFGVLAVMVGFTVWGSRGVRLFAPLIGMAAGYLEAFLTGSFSAPQLASFAVAPLLAPPELGRFGLAFDVSLMVPFAIPTLAMALNTVGGFAAAQQANDAEWKRPDMANISRGVTGVGLTNIVAGVVGGAVQAGSPVAVGLSVASGATSRVIGFGVGALWLLLSLSPKVATVLLMMPASVIGAALMVSICILIMGGVQVVASRLLDTRKIFALGLGLAFGLARLYNPDYFAALPAVLQPFVSSELSVAVATAVGLNALFRIGIHKRARFTVDADAIDARALADFMTAEGKRWGAEAAVVYRASYATQEIVETLTEHGMLAANGGRRIEIGTSFDEFTFTVSMRYDGEPLLPRAVRPTEDEIIESPDGVRLLAAYMIGQAADRVRANTSGGRTDIVATFNT